GKPALFCRMLLFETLLLSAALRLCTRRFLLLHLQIGARLRSNGIEIWAVRTGIDYQAARVGAHRGVLPAQVFGGGAGVGIANLGQVGLRGRGALALPCPRRRDFSLRLGSGIG